MPLHLLSFCSAVPFLGGTILQIESHRKSNEDVN